MNMKFKAESKKTFLLLCLLSVFSIFGVVSAGSGNPIELYVITNDIDSTDRYAVTSFDDLDDKIGELAPLGNDYTLTLNQDLEVTGDNSLTFPGPSKWTVAGNGKTVKKQEGAPVNLNRVLRIGKGGSPSTVTLKNVVIDGANKYRACEIVEGSTLILNSGAIIQNGYSAGGATTGGIHMWKNTKLYLKPYSQILKNISETTSYYGGAIRMISGCVLEIDGATISGNRASNSGGAIWADHSAISITVKNTTFSENAAYSDAYQSHGGAIHSAVLTIIDNCKFKNNSAKNGGGSIFMAPAQAPDNEELIVKNATFSGNKAQYGGAISSHLKTSIKGGIFEGNIASSHGGAVNLTSRSTASLIVDNTVFSGNKAIMGGAIFTQQVTTIKTNTSFSKNEALAEGGAVYTSSLSYANPANSSKYANLNVENTTVFKNNKAAALFNPPSNYADFTWLQFARTSLTGVTSPHNVQSSLISADSLLNNYDVNYKHSTSSTRYPVKYQFESDNTQYNIPAEVLAHQPADSNAELGEVVVPPILTTTIIDLPSGQWKFLGWDKPSALGSSFGITFTGTWQSILRIPITGHKVLKHGALKGGDFTFRLLDKNKKVLAEVTNTKDGLIAFPDRTFSKEVQNYTYTVHEVNGNNGDIVYDNTVYTVKVTTNVVDGHLEATVQVLKDGQPHNGAITFTNCPVAPQTGDKALEAAGTLLGAAVLLLLSSLIVRKSRAKIK